MDQVVAFLSGKGGTGKSALCAAVATLAARHGKKVLAIDCDCGLRNLDIYLGMAQENSLSFADLCRGDYPLSAIPAHPAFPALHVLTAPANRAEIPAREFDDLLAQARQEYHLILLDGPAGLGEGMETLAKIADLSLVVTLPDPASIRCAQRLGQELDKLGAQGKLIVNRVYKELLKALAMDIDDVMDTVGLPLLGVVPSDPGISLAAAKGKALILWEHGGAVAACQRITKRLQGQPVPIASR